MLTIIVSGRNDDYGLDFRERLLRTAKHNVALLAAAGIEFEYFLAEWNPLPDRPLLSEEFISSVPNARALVIPAAIHEAYTLNPQMSFHEMAAKNAALKRARGDVVIVTNADILFGEDLVRRVAAGGWSKRCLYRAHRIDVKPDLDWKAMQNPRNQLPSGEGHFPPPYYLGAGGDFCLATKELWHSLRGFNERIRFSTRAKDWQFFLSAAADGIDIDFIGDVYHLDHDGGFRNTAPDQLNGERVHFGRWWDIEFGLPVQNSAEWGFSGIGESMLDVDGHVTILNSSHHQISDEQNTKDREMHGWLTRPAGIPDKEGAFLLHAICAAHREKRRMICRIKNRGLLATLSGFDAVASLFSVDVRCNEALPVADGYTRHAFTPEPEFPEPEDWLIEEAEGELKAFDQATGQPLDILPRTSKTDEPDFNPVLARRLLYAYLRLQSGGHRTIAIYGRGGHTQQLLKWGIPDSLQVLDCFESLPQSTYADAVVLSSASFESDMIERCRLHNVSNVIALYTDWPREMYAAGVTA